MLRIVLSMNVSWMLHRAPNDGRFNVGKPRPLATEDMFEWLAKMSHAVPSPVK